MSTEKTTDDKQGQPLLGLGSSEGLGLAPERAAREALHEFTQQDDYLLAHGASLISESSHEILHIDTLRRIVDAAVAAERERWAVHLEAVAARRDHDDPTALALRWLVAELAA